MTVPLTSADATTAFRRRADPTSLLSAEADELAAACHAMAGRFHRGGRLLAFGSPSDAAHIVVEFVHPVIIGKRALPAQSLPGDVELQLGLFGQPADIALAITPGSGDEQLAGALATARRMGMLTVALLGAGAAVGADHVVTVASDDERVVREVQVTAYHVLWELVHVFLDAPEVLT